MVRTLSIDKNGLRKGAWSKEEDCQLRAYIQINGHPNWRHLPKDAGLFRSGKSCRLRWVNYLKPGLNKGSFNQEEEELIIHLHEKYGNKWSAIAAKLPGRTDNIVKNFWHGHLKKRLDKETNAISNGRGFNVNEQLFELSEPQGDDDKQKLVTDKPTNPSNNSSNDSDSDGSTLSCFGVNEKQQNYVDHSKVDLFPDVLSTFWTEPFVNMSFYPSLDEEECLY